MPNELDEWRDQVRRSQRPWKRRLVHDLAFGRAHQLFNP